jgi:hypothetical protein
MRRPLEYVGTIRGDARAVRKAVVRAMKRPRTYPGALKEAVWTGLHIALYPVGVLSEALEVDDRVSLGGLSPRSVALPYLNCEAASTPVILLHGYFHNRSGFLVMRRALRRHGMRFIDTMNYNVIGHDVPELAEQLARRVDWVRERTGSDKVHLIGHSLGGLIARYYVQELGGENSVHTCVTLGTPHQGTYAAWIGRGKAARQLRPGSPLLRRLDETARVLPVRFVSYYSNLDGLVIPAHNAKILHPAMRARNVLVKDLGHMSLLISRPLIQSVLATLSDLDDVLTETAQAVVTPLHPRPPRRANGRPANSQGA